MSSRRAARGRLYAAAADPEAGGIPEPLRHQLHPLWRDPDAIMATFPEYAVDDDVSPLRLRLAYFAVVGRWAKAHGFTSENYPQSVDWHRFRAACRAQPTPPPRADGTK